MKTKAELRTTKGRTKAEPTLCSTDLLNAASFEHYLVNTINRIAKKNELQTELNFIIGSGAQLTVLHQVLNKLREDIKRVKDNV